ncbi:hypothetical protein CXB77_17255 [Chromatium okenii]|uniref:Uncharacterized protein n=1 Tax=Chromatium okenii TaxID=61644 RepID=A0A2S7XMB6_9GAMM|nr:hypothetical protein CXB77_17255 [Chromatium okenii]
MAAQKTALNAVGTTLREQKKPVISGLQPTDLPAYGQNSISVGFHKIALLGKPDISFNLMRWQ